MGFFLKGVTQVAAKKSKISPSKKNALRVSDVDGQLTGLQQSIIAAYVECGFCNSEVERVFSITAQEFKTFLEKKQVRAGITKYCDRISKYMLGEGFIVMSALELLAQTQGKRQNDGFKPCYKGQGKALDILSKIMEGSTQEEVEVISPFKKRTGK